MELKTFVVWCEGYDAREYDAESPVDAVSSFVDDAFDVAPHDVLVFVANKASGEMHKFKAKKSVSIEAAEVG